MEYGFDSGDQLPDLPAALPQLGEWIEEHGMAEDVLLNGECTQQEPISLYQSGLHLIGLER